MQQQKWAREEMLRELEREQEELEENQMMELRYAATQNGLMFWLQKKRKKKRLEEDVRDSIRLWTSGLVFNLVDFMIALQEMRDYARGPEVCANASPSVSSGMGRSI